MRAASQHLRDAGSTEPSHWTYPRSILLFRLTTPSRAVSESGDASGGTQQEHERQQTLGILSGPSSANKTVATPSRTPVSMALPQRPMPRPNVKPTSSLRCRQSLAIEGYPELLTHRHTENTIASCMPSMAMGQGPSPAPPQVFTGRLSLRLNCQVDTLLPSWTPRRLEKSLRPPTPLGSWPHPERT